MLKELETFQIAAAFVTRPGASFASVAQLAKRARLGEDLLGRVLARLNEYLGGPVLVPENRRLRLTKLGAELARVAERIEALRETSAGDGPERLVLDCDPWLAEELVAPALPELFAAYGDTVGVDVQPLDPASVVERLGNGTIHLAVGWADVLGGEAAAELAVEVRWVVALPAGHPFPGAVIVPADVPALGRILHAGDERTTAAAGAHLRAGPGRTVVVPSVAAAQAGVVAGVGVGFVPHADGQSAPPGVRLVALAGVPPERPVVLIPRRGTSEPAASLRTLLMARAPGNRPTLPPPPDGRAGEPAPAAVAG